MPKPPRNISLPWSSVDVDTTLRFKVEEVREKVNRTYKTVPKMQVFTNTVEIISSKYVAIWESKTGVTPSHLSFKARKSSG